MCWWLVALYFPFHFLFSVKNKLKLKLSLKFKTLVMADNHLLLHHIHGCALSMSKWYHQGQWSTVTIILTSTCFRLETTNCHCINWATLETSSPHTVFKKCVLILMGSEDLNYSSAVKWFLFLLSTTFTMNCGSWVWIFLISFLLLS